MRRLRLEVFARALSAAVACQALSSAQAVAQEDTVGIPPALEFPVQELDATPLDLFDPSGSLRLFESSTFRNEIEKAGDTALCNAAMEFRYGNDQARLAELHQSDENFCDQDLKDTIRNDGGLLFVPVLWDEGARPTQCGHNCLSAPINTQEQFTDRANLRQVVMYGHLDLRIPTLGHKMSLGYELRFTCRADDGARRGVFTSEIKLDQNLVHEEGALEQVAEFLTPVQVGDLISDYIDGELDGSLTVPASTEGLECVSIGAVQDASNSIKDTVRSSVPGRTIAPGVAAAFADRATVRLLRIDRLPPSPFVAAAPEDSLGLGDFTLTVNGERTPIPVPIGDDPNALVLPPEGGSVSLNMCKSVDISGASRLQLLFANGAGSAAWAELTRAADFGEGGVHTITAGRTVLLPARPGLPDPITGQPTQLNPTPYILREFQLFYQVSFEPSAAPTATIADGASSPIGGGVATDVNRAPDLTAAGGRRVAPGLANTAGRVTAPAVSTTGRQIAPGLSGATVVQAELAPCREL
jgi:hypothetical protein